MTTTGVPIWRLGRHESLRGNEEIAFGRAACLDVNAEIVEMAKSGPGYALYFKREGLVRL